MDLADQITLAQGELRRLRNLQYSQPEAIANGHTIFKLIFGDLALTSKMTRFKAIVKISKADYRPSEKKIFYFSFGDCKLTVHYKLQRGHDDWTYSFTWFSPNHKKEVWTDDDCVPLQTGHSEEYKSLAEAISKHDAVKFRCIMDDVGMLPP